MYVVLVAIYTFSKSGDLITGNILANLIRQLMLFMTNDYASIRMCLDISARFTLLLCRYWTEIFTSLRHYKRRNKALTFFRGIFSKFKEHNKCAFHFEVRITMPHFFNLYSLVFPDFINESLDLLPFPRGRSNICLIHNYKRS